MEPSFIVIIRIFKTNHLIHKTLNVNLEQSTYVLDGRPSRTAAR